VKKLHFVQPNPLVDEAGVAMAERNLGLSLPQEYRGFIVENNGGLSSEGVFDIPGRGQSSIVFYGIRTGHDYSDLVVAYTGYRHRLPDGIVPIGFDPGGNLVCLSVDGEDAGKVWFWDHEKESNPPTRQSLYWLADSFGSFVDSLQFEEIESW
jgi:hypothetical protein